MDVAALAVVAKDADNGANVIDVAAEAVVENEDVSAYDADSTMPFM